MAYIQYTFNSIRNSFLLPIFNLEHLESKYIGWMRKLSNIFYCEINYCWSAEITRSECETKLIKYFVCTSISFLMKIFDYIQSMQLFFSIMSIYYCFLNFPEIFFVIRFLHYTCLCVWELGLSSHFIIYCEYRIVFRWGVFSACWVLFSW